MTQFRQRAGNLPDVDELSPEIRVGGYVAVARIEVAVRVHEGYMHRNILYGDSDTTLLRAVLLF